MITGQDFLEMQPPRPIGLGLAYTHNIYDPSFGACDLSFEPGIELQSAVLMSIFTNARASQEEVSPDEARYGWWADAKIGSKLWLLQREKIVPSLLPRIEQYLRDCLQWLIDDGVAAEIAVYVEQDNINPSQVNAAITIYRTNGDNHKLTFNSIWKGAISG